MFVCAVTKKPLELNSCSTGARPLAGQEPRAGLWGLALLPLTRRYGPGLGEAFPRFEYGVLSMMALRAAFSPAVTV